MKTILLAIAVLLSGCATAPVYQRLSSQTFYETPYPQQVITVYVDPPLYQPPPIRVQWAPPPMRNEVIPYQPYPEAIWTGGYWIWQGDWVWAHGRWAAPPRPGYAWVQPYYEHRGGSVIFINGFWAAPGIPFVRPAPNLAIGMASIANGVVPGRRPIGPEGIFVPPPPGSHRGLIVPAPLGTAPALSAGIAVSPYPAETTRPAVRPMPSLPSSPAVTATPALPRQPDPLPPPMRMPPPVATVIRAPNQADASPKLKPTPEHEKRDRRSNEDGRQNDKR